MDHLISSCHQNIPYNNTHELHMIYNPTQGVTSP